MLRMYGKEYLEWAEQHHRFDQAIEAVKSMTDPDDSVKVCGDGKFAISRARNLGYSGRTSCYK